MKRWLPMIGAVLLASAAHAELDTLRVNFSPDTTEFAKGEVVDASVTANGTGTQYRFVLERKVDGRDVHVMGSVWSSITGFQIDTAEADIPPGRYRLLAMAREEGNRPEHLVRYDMFRVVGTDSPEFADVANRNTVLRNYEHAIAVVRDTLASVKAKLLAQQDVSEEFNAFVTADSLITSVINPEYAQAPGGGNAFTSSFFGSDQLGAVGVWVRTSPVSPDNWAGTTVEIDLPNYLDLDANGDRVVTIRWED